MNDLIMTKNQPSNNILKLEKKLIGLTGKAIEEYKMIEIKIK